MFYWNFECKLDLKVPNRLVKVSSFCDKHELKKLMPLQRGLVYPHYPQRKILSKLYMQINLRNIRITSANYVALNLNPIIYVLEEVWLNCDTSVSLGLRYHFHSFFWNLKIYIYIQPEVTRTYVNKRNSSMNLFMTYRRRLQTGCVLVYCCIDKTLTETLSKFHQKFFLFSLRCSNVLSYFSVPHE